MPTLCALAIVLSVALAPQTASSTSSDPDLKELSTYALSMDTLNKVDRAMRGMFLEMKKDPKFQEEASLKKELETLQAKDEPTEADQKHIEAIEARLEAIEKSGPFNGNSAKSLSDMAAQIQKEPRMVAALQREGLTPREYAKFMLAMVQASFAAGLQKSGMLKTTPEGTNPANIKWVLEHEAELQAMQKAWQLETKK